MYELAKITAYKLTDKGTALQIHIDGVNLKEPILEKHINSCGIWLNDGRTISAEQRKKAYATIADIARHVGDYPEYLKEEMKFRYIAQSGGEKFSLSDCSMDTARGYINYLMDFALENGIILDDLGINRTDDINHYLYACIKNKKCAVCGRYGEIHHWDAIGMGQDRKIFNDSKNRKICLCRVHHQEAHSIGKEEFEDKHKVYGIKYIS